MSDDNCTDLFIRHFPFWKHLSESEKAQFCDGISLMRCEKGTVLHGGGEDCVGVILLKSGQLRTYMLSEDGRDITLYRLYPDDVCVLSASCVFDAITFDVFVEADEESEVMLLNSTVFRRISAQNIYVEAFGYQLATERFSDVMWTMQQILFMSFDRRLAIFLCDESVKTGSDTIHLTHEQIAKYMGSAREVVTRMLKYFAAEGLVSLSRGEIKIIDKKRLRSLT